MTRIDTFILILLLNFMLSSPVASKETGEKTREQLIAEKLSKVADADEIIKLKAERTPFIGIYKRGRSATDNVNESSNDETNGVVILVHGIGAHPDWPDVISPLRIALANSGWSTLSIQMPILPLDEPVADYDKTMKPAMSRIQAAVEYLHDWGFDPIMLLGYSFGAVQAANFLANDQSANNENVSAFVSVSMLTQKFIKPGPDVYKMIGGINIPVLDISGEKDLQEVTSGSDDRRLAALKNNNDGFRQIVLMNAAHNYLGFEKTLAHQVRTWLQDVASDIRKSNEILKNSPEILSETQ